ncbi:MAG: hypothetical protein NVSMB5_07790 [Candidatus Velthaea sp.]
MRDRFTPHARTMRWSFASADSVAARAVRHSFTAYAREVSADDGALDTTAAELVIGELVSNVERHAPGPVRVDVELQPDCIVVTVADQGPGFRLDPHALPDIFAESGRGLFLVDSCSRELTVRTAPRGGCEVRAVISLDPPGGALTCATAGIS